MSPGRWALVVLGTGVAAYGGWLVVGLGSSALPGIALWLAAGVVLHDFVLVPLGLAGGALLSRWVPVTARVPIAVGAIVLGSVTLLAVPVLGRFGARPDNPTLLDRDYSLGWLVLAALVASGVGLSAVLRSRRSRVSHLPGDGG